MVLEARLVGIVLGKINHSDTVPLRQVALHAEPIVVEPLGIVVVSDELGPIFTNLLEERGDGHTHL